MPTIHKFRVSNIRLDDNNKMMSNHTWRPAGNSTLFLLENGGGKSSVIHLVSQVVLPNSTVKDKNSLSGKQLKNITSTGHTINVAVEWNPDSQELPNFITGICYKNLGYITKGTEEKGKFSEEYFTYLIELDSKGISKIEDLPFLNGNRILDLKEVEQELKKFENVTIYRSFKKREYQNVLEYYNIYPKEWKLISKVNLEEGGVSDFFKTMPRTTQLIEKFFVPNILENIYSSDKESNSPINLFLSYKNRILELPHINKLTDELSIISSRSDIILNSVDKYNIAFEKIQDVRTRLWRTSNSINNSISYFKSSINEASTNILDVESELKTLDWKINSYEHYKLSKRQEQIQIKLVSLLKEKTSAEESVNKLTIELNELNASKHWAEMMSLEEHIEAESTSLEVAQMDFAKRSEAYAKEVDKLNKQYSKLYRDNTEKINLNNKKMIKLHEEKESLLKALIDLEEEEKAENERIAKIEGIVELYQDESEKMMNDFKLYSGLTFVEKLTSLDKIISDNKGQNDFLKKEFELVRNQIVQNQLAQQKNQTNLDNAVYEQEVKSKIFDEFATTENRLVQYLKMVLKEDYSIYTSEHGHNILEVPSQILASLEKKQLELQQEIIRRNIKKEHFSGIINMIDKVGYHIHPEIESVKEFLTIRGIHLISGAEWLYQTLLNDDNKKEIVQKHPLLSFSLIIESSQMSGIKKALAGYKTNRLTVPVVFIEKGSLEVGELKSNPFEIESSTFIYHNFDDKFTIEEWEEWKNNLSSEVVELETNLTTLSKNIKNILDVSYDFKQFDLHYSKNSRKDFANQLGEVEKLIDSLSIKKDELTQQLEDKITVLQELKEKLSETSTLIKSLEQKHLNLKNFIDRYKDIEKYKRTIVKLKTNRESIIFNARAKSKALEEIKVKENILDNLSEEFKKIKTELESASQYIDIKLVSFPEDINTDDYSKTKALVQKLNSSNSNEKQQLNKTAELLDSLKKQHKQLNEIIENFGFSVRHFNNKPVAYSEVKAKSLEFTINNEQDTLKQLVRLFKEVEDEGLKLEGSINQLIITYFTYQEPFQYGEFASQEYETYFNLKNDCLFKKNDLDQKVVNANRLINKLESAQLNLSDLEPIFSKVGEPTLSEVEWEAANVSSIVKDLKDLYAKFKSDLESENKNLTLLINDLHTAASKTDNTTVIEGANALKMSLDKTDGDYSELLTKFVTILDVQSKLKAFSEEKASELQDLINGIVSAVHKQGGDLYNYIKELPRHSAVTINNDTFKLFNIRWNKKDSETSMQEIRHYIENVLLERIVQMKDSEGKVVSEDDIDIYVKNQLTPYKILSFYADPEKCVLEVLKPRSKNLEINKTYTTWEKRSSEWSGGEQHAACIAVFITMNTFIRKKRTNNDAPPSVILTDNPFAAASSEHVVAPMIEICRATKTQLISFTDHRKKEIEREFDTVLSNKYVPKNGTFILDTKHIENKASDIDLVFYKKNQLSFTI